MLHLCVEIFLPDPVTSAVADREIEALLALLRVQIGASRHALRQKCHVPVVKPIDGADDLLLESHIVPALIQLAVRSDDICISAGQGAPGSSLLREKRQRADLLPRHLGNELPLCLRLEKAAAVRMIVSLYKAGIYRDSASEILRVAALNQPVDIGILVLVAAVHVHTDMNRPAKIRGKNLVNVAQNHVIGGRSVFQTATAVMRLLFSIQSNLKIADVQLVELCDLFLRQQITVRDHARGVLLAHLPQPLINADNPVEGQQRLAAVPHKRELLRLKVLNEPDQLGLHLLRHRLSGSIAFKAVAAVKITGPRNRHRKRQNVPFVQMRQIPHPRNVVKVIILMILYQVAERAQLHVQQRDLRIIVALRILHDSLQNSDLLVRHPRKGTRGGMKEQPSIALRTE